MADANSLTINRAIELKLGVGVSTARHGIQSRTARAPLVTVTCARATVTDTYKLGRHNVWC